MIENKTLTRNPHIRSTVGLFDDLIRVAIVFALISVAIVALTYNAFLLDTLVGHLHFNDFGKFYYSALNFLSGRELYSPTPATLIQVSDNEFRQFWNLNPPFFTLLMLPLAYFPPQTAFALWSLMSLLAFAFSMRLVILESGIRMTAMQLLVFAVALCWFVGTTSLVATGQLSWLLMWPVTSGWQAVRRQRWNKAGILWGLCISVKPLLLPVLGYFVIRRRYRAAVLSCISIFVVFIISFAIFGIDAHREWLLAMSQSTGWAWASMNASLLSILSRSLTPTPFYRPLADLSFLVRPLWLVGSIGVGLIVLRCLHITRDELKMDEDLLVILLAALIVSPLGWVYYLWLLFGPAFSIANRYPLSPLIKLALLAFLCPFHLTMFGQPSPLMTLSFGSLYAWATLASFWGVVWSINKRVAD
jgi:hypothetical protein